MQGLPMKIRSSYSLLGLTLLFCSGSLVPMKQSKKKLQFLTPLIGVSARQGLRPTMEDEHVAFFPFGDKSEWAFFGVYDGHSGDKASQTAARLLHRFFLNELLKNPNMGRGILFENAFIRTEKQILEEKITAGTTAIVAFLEEFILRLAWVGDSRAVVIRGNTIIVETKDHKPDVLQEKLRIEKVGGKVEKRSINDVWRIHGLAVSRALGDSAVKAAVPGGVIAIPEIERVIVKNNDVIVLACDGLWDVMSNHEVAQMVNSLLQESAPALQKKYPQVKHAGEKIQEEGDEYIKLIARALRDEAFKRGSTDNISVMVVQLK